MTRKQKRQTKEQPSKGSSVDPIAFVAHCSIGYQDVVKAFYDRDFKNLAGDIMELSADQQQAIGELQRLKHMWDLLLDREDLEDVCEAQIEYCEDDLQELYSKVTCGLDYGQGTTLFNVMRLELLQMLLSFSLPDTPTPCCFGTCCDHWIEALSDDGEDDEDDA